MFLKFHPRASTSVHVLAIVARASPLRFAAASERRDDDSVVSLPRVHVFSPTPTRRRRQRHSATSRCHVLVLVVVSVTRTARWSSPAARSPSFARARDLPLSSSLRLSRPRARVFDDIRHTTRARACAHASTPIASRIASPIARPRRANVINPSSKTCSFVVVWSSIPRASRRIASHRVASHLARIGPVERIDDRIERGDVAVQYGLRTHRRVAHCGRERRRRPRRPRPRRRWPEHGHEGHVHAS